MIKKAANTLFAKFQTLFEEHTNILWHTKTLFKQPNIINEGSTTMVPWLNIMVGSSLRFASEIS